MLPHAILQIFLLQSLIQFVIKTNAILSEKNKTIWFPIVLQYLFFLYLNFVYSQILFECFKHLYLLIYFNKQSVGVIAKLTLFSYKKFQINTNCVLFSNGVYIAAVVLG